jgi:hypothetical protein
MREAEERESREHKNGWSSHEYAES